MQNFGDYRGKKIYAPCTNQNERRNYFLLQITREEAEYLRSKDVYIVKSCKLKNNGQKRGKAYCEESARALRELENFRSTIKIVEEYPQKNNYRKRENNG